MKVERFSPFQHGGKVGVCCGHTDAGELFCAVCEQVNQTDQNERGGRHMNIQTHERDAAARRYLFNGSTRTADSLAADAKIRAYMAEKQIKDYRAVASDALIYMGLFCPGPVAPSVGDIQRRLESSYKDGKIKDNDKAVAGIFTAAISFGCGYTAIFPKLLEKEYGKVGISK